MSTDSKQGCLMLTYTCCNDSVCFPLLTLAQLPVRLLDDFPRRHRITGFQSLERERVLILPLLDLVQPRIPSIQLFRQETESK